MSAIINAQIKSGVPRLDTVNSSGLAHLEHGGRGLSTKLNLGGSVTVRSASAFAEIVPTEKGAPDLFQRPLRGRCDETKIVVAGIDGAGQGFVLEDISGRCAAHET